MPTVHQHKVVSALPGTLEANSIYYVRAGSGVDMYVTNSSGLIVAYPLNAGSPHKAGDMRVIPHGNVPSGWAIADGSLYNIAEYPAAFAKLGTTYGGDGVTTFGIPNMIGRGAVGVAPADVGQTGGASTVTLTTDNLPSHGHDVKVKLRSENSASSHAGPPTSTFNILGRAQSGPTTVAAYHDSVGASPVDLGGVTQSDVGQGESVNVTNPYLGVLWIVAMFDIGADGEPEEPGVVHQAFSAGLTASLSIPGSTYQIPVGTSAPTASQGYPLFERTVEVVADELIRLDLAIPFIAISSAGNIVATLCVDGVVVATLVDRLTSGATSGNGINLGTFFTPTETGEITVKVMLGPATSGSTLTLYGQMGAAAQPFLHVLKFGSLGASGSPGSGPVEVAPSPRGLKRLAIFGDSVTGNNSSSSSRERLKDNGYLPWALRFCQQRYFFPQEWNFGVGGDNTADFLARIQTVIDAAPHIAVGTIGGNDVTQSIAVADTINNLTEILDRFEEAGIFVVLGKIYPRGPATTYTTAHMQKASTINNFLQAESLRRRGFELLDANPDFVDFADTTGRGRAKCLPDGIHPGVYGASVLGRRLGELLATLEPPRPDNFTDAGNAYNASTNPGGNLLPNGCMFGSGGTVAIGTGQIATDSRIDAAGSGLTVVCDVASQEVPGAYDNTKERTRVVVSGTAGGAGHQIVFKQDAVTIPVGATVEGLATVRVSGMANARAMQLDIRAEHTSGILYAVDCEVGDAAGASGVAGEIIAPASGEHFDWVLRTPRIVVPSGTSSLSLRIATGAGPSQTVALTFEVFDMTLRIVD